MVSNIFLIFTPIWGRFPFLTNILQVGWNHQLAGVFTLGHLCLPRCSQAIAFQGACNIDFHGIFSRKYHKNPPPPEEGPIDLLFRSWSKKLTFFWQHVRLIMFIIPKMMFITTVWMMSHISIALWLGTKRTLFKPFSQWMFLCLLWAKYNSANYSITFVLKWIHIPYLLYT